MFILGMFIGRTAEAGVDSVVISGDQQMSENTS